MNSTYIKSANLDIHCLDTGGNKEPLILCHGLTANAYCFSGYLEAGLAEHFRVVAVDLRGRGLSGKPENAYSMDDHMKDLIAVTNHFGWESAIIGGHSFGALLSIYTSYFHPELFKAMILIDAAAHMHPNSREMVTPAMDRLEKVWPSEQAFLNEMKRANYLDGTWSDALSTYFKADISKRVDGTVTTQSKLNHIIQAVDSLNLGDQWLTYISSSKQPTLLINSIGPYQNGDPLLPEELAKETVSAMKHCTYVQVPGNHITMMFGQGAVDSVAAITTFIEKVL